MKSEHLSYLEYKAKEEKRDFSGFVYLIMLITPLSMGIYYWFIDELLFSYDTVGPFSGFFLFFIIAILLTTFTHYLGKAIYKSHNAEIDKANETILNLINSQTLQPNDLFRLKKDYIERRINKGEITNEEFKWHSGQICWGCGNFHEEKKYNYCYRVTKTRTYKKGAIRYSQTLEKTAHIPLCESCYKAVCMENKSYEKNKPFIIIIDVILSILTTLLCAYLFEHALDGILAGIAICGTFGQLILIPIAYIISIPFIDNKRYFKPKWNFNLIPTIKKFLDSY